MISGKNSQETVETKEDIQVRTPRIDVYESDTDYYIRMSLPGVQKENLHVKLLNDQDLEIKGNVYSSHPDHINQLVAQEIFEGPFYRLIRFPTYIRKNSISFDYKAGILQLSIKKGVSE
ncbi:Hsp20/alpha crystallin family protein [Radiobacillus kanasensis]|uniref:Hsp20/alpha crystallin family protein n=1 Tax=Radiobacillus kanasensis TaxID=2844358 RepID=UPI001E2D726C|nr:Hsp20/alpha crystallin family protein [Radiobacillus kanasensis]UFU00553.1 Hsp20/alpha crystallin family protein [Radiobacillus kanasensis]